MAAEGRPWGGRANFALAIKYDIPAILGGNGSS